MRIDKFRKSVQNHLRFSLYAIAFLLVLSISACQRDRPDNGIEVEFNREYGQLEIGGTYVGALFFKSRPLPSRISFYYPVANSIDFSTDYWQRHRSCPLTVILASDAGSDTLGKDPYPYRYTPFSARFEDVQSDFKVRFSYDVCEDVPVLVLRLGLENRREEQKTISVQTILRTGVRTSHTYALKNSTSIQYTQDKAVALAYFDDAETDSAVLFVANAGLRPVGSSDDKSMETGGSMTTESDIHFKYEKDLKAGQHLEIILLMGMCRQDEYPDVIIRSMERWHQSIQKNKTRILDYARNRTMFLVEDPALQQTALWAKAVLAANRHYIDGWVVPMPCPAEYNFFFTHDLLVTGLGVVAFDPDYVRHGYRFLMSLTGQDSTLAHAYYWKDGRFVTEYCQSDNWNHLWFIISAASYLKHSGDLETLGHLFPVLRKSLRMMLENKGEDDLMYARRPDWWDTGDVYGARAYITSLMIKALQDFCYISMALGETGEDLEAHIKLAGRMKDQLVRHLWDDKADFLMNGLDEDRKDHHYYSGSLVAAVYDCLDDDKKIKLLNTAKAVLLDEKIGIRNAMPADFHRLISMYHFKGMESGLPYVYFNGGVWPQNNAWYALGLLASQQPDRAKEVLKKYMTLEGIRQSPNGQPSFYEYRMTDPDSPQYGEIDKPTFLWAGGWTLHVLYRLAGLHENSWNVSFSPNLPEGFDNTEYDVMINGRACRVRWSGHGPYFHEIRLDGKTVYSAVMTKPARGIVLKRGLPKTPYLSAAQCIVEDVAYSRSDRKMTIHFSGIPHQPVGLKVVSPMSVKCVEWNDTPFHGYTVASDSEGIHAIRLRLDVMKKRNVLVLYF